MKLKLLLKSKSKPEMEGLASQLSCSETLADFKSALLKANKWMINLHEHYNKTKKKELKRGVGGWGLHIQPETKRTQS